jgi:hypothetical protein
VLHSAVLCRTQLTYAEQPAAKTTVIRKEGMKEDGGKAAARIRKKT